MGGGEARDWPRELRSGGPATDAALSDLRGVLLRGLRRGLSGRAGADDALIEDLAQEATLRVLDRLDGYRGESRFTTWAVTIAVRVALTELRRPRWRDVSLDRLAAEDRGDPPDPPSPAPGPPREAERREILDLLRKTLEGGLTERQRAALVGELRGMPQEEIARQLGIGRNALYKLGHDARQRLKGRLIAAGVTDEDVRAAFDL
ncbi:MAG: sigma-70 family RNA polymerase sigma factor [Isosphaeraceae bacterium]